MSTFKRLFNVGRGKAKGVQRDVEDALGRTSEAPGEWADKARHKAADAAEALADVIRPGEAGAADASASPTTAAVTEPEVGSATSEAAPNSDPEEPIQAERPDPSKPKKRTL